eukprot:Opistho-2@8750
MPTTSMSLKFWMAERSTLRPMRPKPLIPILIVIGSLFKVAKSKSGICRCTPAGSGAQRAGEVLAGLLGGLQARSTGGHQHGIGHVLFCEAEVLEQHGCGGRFTVGVDTHHGGAAVLPPAVGHAHFHGHARHAGGQHAALVLGVFAVKGGGAGHGDHAHRHLLVGQQALGLQGQLHFGAGGDDHGHRLLLDAHIGRLAQHVGAARDVAQVALGCVGQILARQCQHGGLVAVGQGHAPGHGGFGRVGGAPHIQVGDQAQAGHVLDGLVRGAVFAQADGVVGEHVDHALLHQRGHADGVAAVVAEREEGAAVGDEAAVQRHAVHDGGHAELTHAVVDVAAAHASLVLHHVALHVKAQVGRALGVGEVGAGQVSAAAQQFGQGGGEGFQRQLAGLAAGHGLALGVGGHHRIDGHLRKVGGQVAVHAACQLGGQFGEGGGVGGKTLVPGGLGALAVGLGIPACVHVFGDHEGFAGPAQGFAGQRDFFSAQGLAVGLGGVHAVGASLADVRLAHDQGGAIGLL